MSERERVPPHNLQRLKFRGEFKTCCDCGCQLSQANISTHQPMRCQPCWLAAAEQISTTLGNMIREAHPHD